MVSQAVIPENKIANSKISKINMDKSLIQNIENLHERIRTIVENARKKVYQAANYEMLEAYWEIGKEIIEEEQNGKKRAQYGKYILKDLSLKLTKEFGQGFDQSKCVISGCFIQFIQNVTHCVTNYHGHIIAT